MKRVLSRGCQGDQRARVLPAGPLSGWQGARFGEVPCAVKERPVDAMAVARVLAKRLDMKRVLSRGCHRDQNANLAEGRVS